MTYDEYLRIMDALNCCPMTMKESGAIANFVRGLVEEE